MDGNGAAENSGPKVYDLTKPEGAFVDKNVGLGLSTNGVAEPVPNQAGIISAPEVTPSVNGTAPVTASAEQPFAEPSAPQITAEEIENATKANSAKGLELAGQAKDNVSLQYDQARAELAELINAQGGKIGGEGYDRAVDKVTETRRKLDFANERYTNTLNTAVTDKDLANSIRESVMRESHPETYGLSPVQEPIVSPEPVVPPQPAPSPESITPATSQLLQDEEKFKPIRVTSTSSEDITVPESTPATTPLPSPEDDLFKMPTSDNSLPTPEPTVSEPAETKESLAGVNDKDLREEMDSILDNVPKALGTNKYELFKKASDQAYDMLKAAGKKIISPREMLEGNIRSLRKMFEGWKNSPPVPVAPEVRPAVNIGTVSYRNQPPEDKSVYINSRKDNTPSQNQPAFETKIVDPLDNLDKKGLKNLLDEIWSDKTFKTATDQNVFHREVDRMVEMQLGILSADERKKIESNPEAKMRIIIANAKSRLEIEKTLRQ